MIICFYAYKYSREIVELTPEMINVIVKFPAQYQYIGFTTIADARLIKDNIEYFEVKYA